MLCEQKDIMGGIYQNNDGRLIVDIHPPKRVIRSMKSVFYEYGRIEQQQKKEDSVMEELLQLQRDSLNRKLGDEYLFINQKIPKKLMRMIT